MMNQFYQDSKPVIMQLLGLSKDAIHMHVGFLTFLAAWFLLRKFRERWVILLPSFMLSLSMEILDFCMDLKRGVGSQPLAYLHDLLNTNLIPVLVFLLLRRKQGSGTMKKG